MNTVTVKWPHDGSEDNYRVFADLGSFINHCARHLVNETDCWTSLIDVEQRHAVRKAITFGSSTLEQESFRKGVLGEVYSHVTGVVNKQMSLALSSPQYVIDFESGEVSVLSPIGLLIIIRNRVIRTAYFKASIVNEREFWFDIAKDSLVRKFAGHEYKKQERLLFVSKENWRVHR